MDDLCSMGSNPMVGSDYSTAGRIRQTKREVGENSRWRNESASGFHCRPAGEMVQSCKACQDPNALCMPSGSSSNER